MRKFLVVLDDSRECLNAMRFAAMRAANTGGGVAILSVIAPDEFNHWIGVGAVMREEARERIYAHFEVFAKWMRDKQNIDPELVIREGDAVPEIIAHIQSDPPILGGFWCWGGRQMTKTVPARSFRNLCATALVYPFRSPLSPAICLKNG